MGDESIWAVGVTCPECGRGHTLHAQLVASPRSFSYQCPSRRVRVSVRFVDPSVITSPWTEVQAPNPDSIAVLHADAGGPIDV